MRIGKRESLKTESLYENFLRRSGKLNKFNVIVASKIRKGTAH